MPLSYSAFCYPQEEKSRYFRHLFAKSMNIHLYHEIIFEYVRPYATSNSVYSRYSIFYPCFAMFILSCMFCHLHHCLFCYHILPSAARQQYFLRVWYGLSQVGGMLHKSFVPKLANQKNDYTTCKSY